MKRVNVNERAKGPISGARVICVGLLLASSVPATAQKNLPAITITAPAYTSRHGGYLISGDFKVDPRMPQVVFPAQALVKDDILSVQPVHLTDNEYLVVQECFSADCRQAALVRVWNANGATTYVRSSENRIWIKHENKYFIWLAKLPWVSPGSCDGCAEHFNQFQHLSAPLTLVPAGQLAAQYAHQLEQPENIGAIPVQSQKHEGSSFVVQFVGGSTVRIKRMHAAD